MTVDTSKITEAADFFGQEISDALIALDSQIAALDARITKLETTPSEPPVSGDTSGRITEFSIENMKIDEQLWYVHSARKPWSVTQVDDYELRFEIRQGERMHWDGDYCERSSIQWGNPDGSTPMRPIGSVISSHYKLFIEPGDEVSSPWFVLSQAHNDDEAANAATSPPIAVEFQQGHMVFILRHCPSNQNPSNSAGNLKYKELWKDQNPTARGVWHEVKIEAKNNNDNSGYCKIWFDGVQVADYGGPVGFGYGLYWEMGPYRETHPATFAAHYRNVTHT